MKLVNFKNRAISIHKRIILGFSVICLLMVIIGIMSLWGIFKLNDFSKEYLGIIQESDWQIDIDYSLMEIHRDVLRYMYLGHQSAKNSALDKMTALMQRIEKSIVQSQNTPATLPILQTCRQQLMEFSKTFNDAIKEKQIQTELVQVHLPRTIETLQSRLIDFHDQLEIDHDADHAINVVVNFNNKIKTYFESLDYANVREADEIINQLRKEILQKQVELNNENQSYGELLAKDFELLQGISRRAVQATRGYLFLINVVMSGNTAEMMHQTSELRKSAEASKTLTSKNLYQFTNLVSLSILLVVIITVTAGIIYAILTAGTISRPITRITETLVSLSEGKTVEVIPGMDYHNEIGSLAQSAERFHQRNAETESLLAKSEQLTDDLVKKQREIESANQELEQFVYTVSHDLKSPIITSLGFINIVRDLFSNGQSEEAIKKLDRIELANTRMSELINDLLELSRAGKVEQSLEIIDSEECIMNLVDSSKIKAIEAGFEIEIKGPFPKISANKSRFTQIMENLISNALKYGRDEAREISRVEINCRRDDAAGQYIFMVRDYGKGVPEEFHEKIFVLFNRLGSEEGTGIGLTIVRKLARLYGGDAWIKLPENGSGSLFCVSFPIVI